MSLPAARAFQAILLDSFIIIDNMLTKLVGPAEKWTVAGASALGLPARLLPCIEQQPAMAFRPTTACNFDFYDHEK
jgi:hypothetical protein